MLKNAEENKANVQLKQDNRDRLLLGVDQINEAEGQIQRIKGAAIETHEIVIEANRELHDQGKIIEKAEDNVAAINKPVDNVKKMTVQMTRKEYWYKFLLYVLILLFLFGDIASVVHFVYKK